MKKILLAVIFVLSLASLSNAALAARKGEVMGVDTFALNGLRHQSSAAYGRYLFIVKAKMASITLYDLASRRIVYRLKLKPHMERTESKSVISSDLWHCNQSSFGTERYAKDDMFPLLYISQRNVDSTRRAFCVVMRILPKMSGDTISSFRVKQVQTIVFPPMSDTNCLGTPNVTLSPDGRYMYTYSRNNRQEAANGMTIHVARFALPRLRDAGGNVRDTLWLSDADIEELYPLGFSALGCQGGAIQGDKLYIFQGSPGKGPVKNPVYLRTIDLKRRKLLSTQELTSKGLGEEPEGAFFYQGKLMTSANGKGIYRIRLKR